MRGPAAEGAAGGAVVGDRVAQEVGEDLADGRGVTPRRQGRIDHGLHVDACGARGGAVPVDDVGDRVGQRDLLALVVGRHGATRAEEAVDDREQPLAGAHDDRPVPLHAGRDVVGRPVLGVVEQALGVAEDRGQRRTQLVPDRAEELLGGQLRLRARLDGLGQRPAGLLEGEASGDRGVEVSEVLEDLLGPAPAKAR